MTINLTSPLGESVKFAIFNEVNSLKIVNLTDSPNGEVRIKIKRDKLLNIIDWI